MSNSSLITSINQNTKQALNAKSNDLVTMFSNDIHRALTQSEIHFIKKAYDINVVSNHYWSRFDFPHMNQGNFRKMVCKLKPLITKHINSRPPFYKLNRVYFDELVTIKDTGVTPKTVDLDFDKLLFKCKQQPPFFHDIRLHTRTDLYEKLLNTSHKLNSHNKAYVIPVPVDPRFTVKVNVNKSKMFLIVGCPVKGIPFSPDGFGQLSFLMGKTVTYLRYYAGSEFLSEPIGNWVLTYYHLNHDLIIDSTLHHHTINDLTNQSQLYIKRYDDNKVLRYEDQISSPQTINEIQQEFK